MVGAAIWVGGHLGLGRLPGDFRLRRGGFSLHTPLATSLVISAVLTLLLNVIMRRR